MLDTSHKSMPLSSDNYPSGIAKEKISIKSLFPKYKMLNEAVFDKLDLETLFFIFYF